MPVKKGSSAGSAALLGVIVHEDRTLLADAVDVRRFTHHQATVIDAWLHPADIVAHDEEDVGLCLLLLRGCRARHRDGGKECQHREPDHSSHAHDYSYNLE